MIPIKDFLIKIKWGEKESSLFLIGYWDNMDKKLIFINFNEIGKIEGNFLLLDREEETYILMHRIREVRQEGRIVWKRQNT
jgi:uncharacterized protein (UPF0248 family)